MKFRSSNSVGALSAKVTINFCAGHVAVVF